MVASPDLVLALVLCLLIRLGGPLHALHKHPILEAFFRVDVLYLDSLVDVLTTPSDPVLAFVQETVLSECRWPLRFAELPSTLPLLWSVWTSMYRRALRRRGSSLKVLASAALVLSSRCLRHLVLVASRSAMASDGATPVEVPPGTPEVRPSVLVMDTPELKRKPVGCRSRSPVTSCPPNATNPFHV